MRTWRPCVLQAPEDTRPSCRADGARGYGGCGGLVKADLGNGTFQLDSTGGEPHGVIRFAGAVSSITWTSLTNENGNGFTVGTYGLALPVPEPTTWALMASGLFILVSIRRSRG